MIARTATCGYTESLSISNGGYSAPSVCGFFCACLQAVLPIKDRGRDRTYNTRKGKSGRCTVRQRVRLVARTKAASHTTNGGQ